MEAHDSFHRYNSSQITPSCSVIPCLLLLYRYTIHTVQVPGVRTHTALLLHLLYSYMYSLGEGS